VADVQVAVRSGGKRVTTRPPCLPAARSRSTMSRMKSLPGVEGVVSGIAGGPRFVIGNPITEPRRSDEFLRPTRCAAASSSQATFAPLGSPLVAKLPQKMAIDPAALLGRYWKT